MNRTLFKRIARPLGGAINALIASRRGNATVEFALILPVAALLIAGMIEFGIAAYDGTSLEDAARVGAQYAIQKGLDTTGIQTVVKGATKMDPQTLNVTSQQFYECSGAWGTHVDPTTTCSGNAPLAKFIQVTVAQNYTPIFPFFATMVPSQLHGQATVRVP
jgi:Flp pilus assembly protein TadG